MAVDVNGKLVLEGDGSWPWLAPFVDGADIVVPDCAGTYFTGSVTASGTSADAPGLLGVALPMNVANCPETVGSPIPELPYVSASTGLATQVRVYNPATDIDATGILIDIGPAKSTGHGIDLTEAFFAALGADLSQGVIPNLRYRILGGAQYVEGL